MSKFSAEEEKEKEKEREKEKEKERLKDKEKEKEKEKENKGGLISITINPNTLPTNYNNTNNNPNPPSNLATITKGSSNSLAGSGGYSTLRPDANQGGRMSLGHEKDTLLQIRLEEVWKEYAFFFLFPLCFPLTYECTLASYNYRLVLLGSSSNIG